MIDLNEISAPICFIRHGQTDWNIEQRFQGQSDIRLNATGKNQAIDNAALLVSHLDSSNIPTMPVISSPLVRATQTAELILTQLGRSKSDYVTRQRLQEISFGKFEGLTSAEAKQKFYEERQRRRKDRWAIAPPNGESFAERLGGVSALLTELPAHSLIISHSGIMRIVFHILQKLPAHKAVNLEIPHVGVHIWDGKQLFSR